MSPIIQQLTQLKTNSRELSRLSDELRQLVLLDLARRLESCEASILVANQLDLAQMNSSDPKYDRLQLSETAYDLSQQMPLSKTK